MFERLHRIVEEYEALEHQLADPDVLAEVQAGIDEVNKQFTELFQELFRGGTAEMRLLDEEDLLDSGIEIVARPPGKRLQNIMLLSGGEKALTAVAPGSAVFSLYPAT